MHHDFIFTTLLNLISIILSGIFCKISWFSIRKNWSLYSANFFVKLHFFHYFNVTDFSIFHLFKIDFHLKNKVKCKEIIFLTKLMCRKLLADINELGPPSTCFQSIFVKLQLTVALFSLIRFHIFFLFFQHTCIFA